MPIHDWTRVDAGNVRDFHLEWIRRIEGAPNGGLLPPGYDALAEQQVATAEPDVVTLGTLPGPGAGAAERGGAAGLKTAPARASLRAEVDVEFPLRKQRAVVVRHVGGDEAVALIEVVSPGNADSRRAPRAFVDRAIFLLERRVHLMVLDLFPSGPRDPRGLHGAIWEEAAGREFVPPAGKPLTFVSYEAGASRRASTEPLAVGDPPPEMPLFLEPGGDIDLPLEPTDRDAFAAVPARWREVVAGVA